MKINKILTMFAVSFLVAMFFVSKTSTAPSRALFPVNIWDLIITGQAPIQTKPVLPIGGPVIN